MAKNSTGDRRRWSPVGDAFDGETAQLPGQPGKRMRANYDLEVSRRKAPNISRSVKLDAGLLEIQIQWSAWLKEQATTPAWKMFRRSTCDHFLSITDSMTWHPSSCGRVINRPISTDKR